MPLMAVCWEAQSSSDVGKILVEGVKNLKISKTSIFGGVAGIVKGLASVENARTVMGAYQDSKSLFSKARDNAKMTGRILGHFLACNPLFDSYSVSLVGFSLGSQIIKSTLSTIYKHHLPHKSQIENVYFMGGATFIKEQKIAHQKAIFAKVVNGRICNVHTNNDTTLVAFQEWFKV